MRIGFDVAVPTTDGTVLRGDVFLPAGGSRFPVIMSMGPYGKGRRFQDEPYASRWRRLVDEHPDVLAASACDYMTYETVDPQLWTAAGYAVVRVDSRGTGASPGHLEIFSPQETADYHDAIEWVGTQPWSSGAVGLCGISYYAINQWRVAALRPPHLAAICPWEGALDNYRDMTRHGGILSNLFYELWYPNQVLSNQHGLGENGPVNPWTGQPATGAETLSNDDLAARRTDPIPALREHILDDDWHRARTPDVSQITVPVLSAANWFGQGLHGRGNFEAFTSAASVDRWLAVHPGRHEEWFYLPDSVALQQQFFDHFLKGEDNGWPDTPRVVMHVPDTDGGYRTRTSHTWPPHDTIWTELHLNPVSRTLDPETPQITTDLHFAADGEGLTFTSAPMVGDTDIVGPMAARLHVSTYSSDTDLFLTVRVIDPDGSEVTFVGAIASEQVLSNGWLRLSHRKSDPTCSLPWRPWHTHDENQPAEPGVMYVVDVEIWPTGVHLPVGYSLALTIGGHDYARPGQDPTAASLFLHTDPHDRPIGDRTTTTTLHFSAELDNTLLVPTTPVLTEPPSREGTL
ncbi:CocE/NonD family hydrolase [Williamsia deligens]|uniref:CocE/NonD family hydrolase n=1 Tax=Williamsia deligens TaxID=321325 RepID=A0ABW3G4S0_9NOCA|nr:CocE/NonD family hydrolase [Williamsia deligens]